MYRRILAALAAAIFAVTLTVSATPAQTAPAQSSPLTGVHHDEPPCPSVHDYNVLLRKAVRYSVGGYGGDYHAERISKSRIHRLGAMRACWKPIYRPAYRVERRAWTREMRAWHFHALIDAVTPFGEWAIPWACVHRESHGNYRIPNSEGSGATGAYQIMYQTWHANGGGRYANEAMYAAPAAQHLVAHRLYSSSRLGPWGGHCP